MFKNFYFIKTSKWLPLDSYVVSHIQFNSIQAHFEQDTLIDNVQLLYLKQVSLTSVNKFLVSQNLRKYFVTSKQEYH